MRMYYFLSLAVLALRCNADTSLEDLWNKTVIVEGDIILYKSPDTVAARGAVCEQCRRWLLDADNTYHVPYQYHSDTNYSASILQKFDWSFRYIESVTNVKMVPRTNESSYVLVVRTHGCSSNIGWQGPGISQFMSIQAPGCDHIKTIIHEFGHTLGLGHEQSHPDREKYVTIHWENIISGHAGNFQIWPPYVSGVQFSAYDVASIMHYQSTAFAISGLKTITTKDPAHMKIIDGARIEFSICDITEINLMYPGIKKAPTCVPHQLPSGVEPIPSNQSNASQIERCRYNNARTVPVDGGSSCQIVGGGDLPPVPPGILTEDTTAKPTTAPQATTIRPTVVTASTTQATPIGPTVITASTTRAPIATTTTGNKKTCRWST